MIRLSSLCHLLGKKREVKEEKEPLIGLLSFRTLNEALSFHASKVLIGSVHAGLLNGAAKPEQNVSEYLSFLLKRPNN